MPQLNLLEKFGVFGMVVTAGVVLYVVKKVFGVIWTYSLGPALNKIDFKSKGKWALITGCTDGIGKEYARQLAAMGCDIVLVSRSMDKLKATANEIEQEFKVNTKIIQADFTDNDSIYEKMGAELADLEIGTLVNNVGISYPYPEFFLDCPDWENLMNGLVKANIVSMIRMTALVMPGMVKRKKGVVINVGSGSSTTPSPMLTGYAASKAFAEKFSEGLEQEYSKQGIIVQCILPGFVCSNMSGITRPSFFAPTAKTYVKSAIALAGTESHTFGFFPHAILLNSINYIYSISKTFAVWLVMRNMLNTRSRALKKYGKKAN